MDPRSEAVRIVTRSETVSVVEADLLQRIAAHGKALYLKSHDLRRARRLLGLGLTIQGHLGDRYFGLSDSGARFVENMTAHAHS